jgi:DNA-binding NarL/FixJ family response regulator
MATQQSRASAAFSVIVATADPGTDRVATLLSDLSDLTVEACPPAASCVVETARTIHPQAVVLSLHHVARACLDTVRRLKALAEPPVAIVLSDYDEPELRAAVAAAGADYFFSTATGCEAFQRAVSALRQEWRHDG